MAKRRTNTSKALAAWQEQNPLSKWRKQQHPEGWNQSVLARQLGVSPAAVGTWEKGQRTPGGRMMAKIEKLTGITSAQWMIWQDKKPKDG